MHRSCHSNHVNVKLEELFPLFTFSTQRRGVYCMQIIGLSTDNTDASGVPGPSFILEDLSNPDIVSITKVPSPFRARDVKSPTFEDLDVSFEDYGGQPPDPDKSKI